MLLIANLRDILRYELTPRGSVFNAAISSAHSDFYENFLRHWDGRSTIGEFRRRAPRTLSGRSLAKKKVALLRDGQWNALIDTIIHPATKKRPEFWALDTLLHAAVEGNSEVTLRKFIKYTVPKLLKEATREKK
jgi:hypothetical protein